MSNKALITLQLGHYSNFVGSHFWNIQESNFVYTDAEDLLPDINHDILFREGKTLDNQITYTPRLIVVDLKGSLGNLPQYGDLYESSTTNDTKLDFGMWDGETNITQEDDLPKNDFQKELEEDKDDKKESDDDLEALQDLDGQISLWSDFLKTRYHPKTISIVEEYQHNNTLKPFDVYGLGTNSWNEDGLGDDIEDNIRFFAEEADNLQGFQIIVDNYNAFSGVNSSLLDLLQDDYHNKFISLFPVQPCHFEEYSVISNGTRFINTALNFESSMSKANIVTPLSLSKTIFTLPDQQRDLTHINYNSKLSYHSSAILASCLDALTNPLRSRNNPLYLWDILDSLTPRGRKLTSAAISFPLPFKKDSYFDEYLLNSDLKSVSLTPNSEFATNNVAVQSVALRGIDKNKQKKPISGEKYLNNPYNSGNDNLKDMLHHRISEQYKNTLNIISVSELSCPLKRPYPQFFSDKIDVDGFIKENSVKTKVNQAPMLTWWQNSQETAQHVNTLSSYTKKIQIKKYHRFLESGLEDDLFAETQENLQTIYENYKD